MHLPLRNLSTVYHVGTLNEEDRGSSYSSSHEGSWLSASLCPEAWRKIARLGNAKTWSLCNSNAQYLDVHAMTQGQRAAVNAWAAEHGLIEAKSLFELRHFDEEAECWRTSLFMSRAAAQAELEDLELEGEVSPIQAWVLTQVGRERAKQGAHLQPAEDFALQFWVEDELLSNFPWVFGVYWDEAYNPYGLSAPRVAILPSMMPALQGNPVECLDHDELLLERVSPVRWLAPPDFTSPYVFITDCVSSNAESIESMTDNPASREITHEELMERLGTKAKRLLDDVFPIYRDTKAAGLTLGTDRGVSFHESSFEGAPCLYVVHSAIEYVFQRKGLRSACVEADQDDSVRRHPHVGM